MWEGLEAVDWAGLEHNYGSAEDVPGLLRRCAGQSPEDAQEAAFELLNLLFHQGGWICSAAPAALPFLLRLAADPHVQSRRAVLELVSRLAAEAGQVAERFLDPGWSPTWERALPDVLSLLTDFDPEVRRTAADVVGVCASPGALLLPALLRCWRAERDLVNRLDLVLALGQAVRREPVGGRSDEVSALLRTLLDSPEPQLRLAAVHALTAGDSGLAASQLELVLDAVRDPSVELWQRTSSVETGTRGVQHWTAGLFAGESPAFALGLLADHPDEEQRVGGLAQAGGLLSQWRSPADVLLPAIVARLDDPATEVRYRAAELLSCLGPSAATCADMLAELLGDTATRNSRKGETVAEAALWALARMNDPRCVPGLAERVAGNRSGFASVSASYGSAGSGHYPALPALHEVLIGLPDHAELLLPGICDRLGTTTDVGILNQLCEVLAAWGPAAKVAVPQLLDLLGDDQRWAAAATALAGIGPAGNGGRELLLARSTVGGGADAELAAWAYWQVGGEPKPALKVLGPAATEGRFSHPALRKLAGLGPHAAPFAGQLRTMVGAADTWTSVEAAYALWAATGETENTVPALLEAVHDLAEGTYLPVMLPAVRHLTRIGRVAQPAAHLLSDLPTCDRRLHYFGGWRAFTEDEAIRTAVDELLTAAD
ncbi:HEAT repeat domain-containing protein [Streptomyces sp. CNS654]|uniref:HEAT repeat domain-containing protein n=1 Tax=Streptomyces sp. CNS654 TaxID=1506995 RepID=UPI000515A2F8|nr:HEAT repeat domain-containing protein [Streptomyces sp. CNS654]